MCRDSLNPCRATREAAGQVLERQRHAGQIIGELNKNINAIIADPAMKAHFLALGLSRDDYAIGIRRADCQCRREVGEGDRLRKHQGKLIPLRGGIPWVSGDQTLSVK